jgi:starch synthase
VRVVFVASEGLPFSKTGGLGDVIGALPKALVYQGLEVEVLLPRHQSAQPAKIVAEGRSVTIPLSAGFHFASIQDGGILNGVHYYLVDCPEFFDRPDLYQDRDTGKDYPDNYLRFAAFSLAAVEFIKRLGAPPEIIHCHDWQTALVPVYLKRNYGTDPFYNDTRVVLTVHNLAYQGQFPRQILREISLDNALFDMEHLEFYGKVNLLKGGLVFADAITTVSPRYAQEIQTAESGAGLEGVLQKYAGRLRGILNGADYDVWNPSTDPLIPAHYTPRNLNGKKECKRALLEKMGVTAPVLSRPVLGIISRFDPQKGFDLVAEVAGELGMLDMYTVVLGTGVREYEELFERLAREYPEKFLVKIAYDNALAHLIEAGSDIFLIPSRYEPCGLNQMYSLKYGTVPVVRATGGLDDTVEGFDGASGTGFKFYEYSGAALIDALGRALEAYRRPRLWSKIVANGMLRDFSWTRSARAYADLYNSMITIGARQQTGVAAGGAPGAYNRPSGDRPAES